MKSESLPKIERPNPNPELARMMGGITVNITIQQPHAVPPPVKPKDDTKRLAAINAEMLKMMKKEKKPVFEPNQETNAERFIK